MQSAVISDLHLGPGDATERCVHRDETLLRWLDELEANHERIVLLGDIWETLTDPTRPGSSARMLSCARQAHARIAERFEKPMYEHLCGNHDRVAQETGAREQWTHRAGGDRYLFVHGDILDNSNETRWLSTVGVYLGGWLLRAGLERTFSAFEQYAHRRVDNAPAALHVASGSSMPDAGHTAYRLAALELAQTTGADIIVAGHTHRACRLYTDTGVYLNSGSVLNHEVSWLSLDTARGHSELYRRVLTDPSEPCLRQEARARRPRSTTPVPQLALL